MPPFRTGELIVDRNFDGPALSRLREVGHGHRINIVDASYDIPDGAYILRYPGMSAQALMGIVRLIPVEGPIIVMERDPQLAESDPREESVSVQAYRNFIVASGAVGSEGISLDITSSFREGKNGFYETADNATKSTYFKTIDELPFACASLIVGHSQVTD